MSPQNYKSTLQTQVLQSAGERLGSIKFGADLSEGKLGNFQEEQMGQLYELMLESTKPNRQFDIQEDGKWSRRPQKCALTKEKQKVLWWIQTTNILPLSASDEE